MATTSPNIFIIGAQCTGKTTLVKALEDHYSKADSAARPKIISEVARSVMRRLDVHRHDIANSPERSFMLQRAILEAQLEAENVIAEDMTSWYISDRSGIDPVVYTRLFVGPATAEELLSSSIYLTLEANMKRGLVFVCEAGCSWLTDDGTRLMPTDTTQWHEFDTAFREMLQERNIQFEIIPRDLAGIEDRVGMVVGLTSERA